MIKQEDVFKIGRLGKPHGVNGEVSFMFDDDIFDRADSDYLILEIDGILVPFYYEEYRFHGNETALVKFCDIDTQDQAREPHRLRCLFPAPSVAKQ
jgi:16S rRNA processing protein RimM